MLKYKIIDNVLLCSVCRSKRFYIYENGIIQCFVCKSIMEEIVNGEY